MDKAATLPAQTLSDHETREELIGVLTAISVVSKQLAKKISQLTDPEEKSRQEPIQ